jgi:hypothetical protein
MLAQTKRIGDSARFFCDDLAGASANFGIGLLLIADVLSSIHP